jgi:hypothetical protein
VEKRKFLALPGLELQSVASRYTVCAIPQKITSLLKQTAERAGYGLNKEPNSQYLGRDKCALCKRLVRPMLTNRSESWPLEREDENMLRIFEK